VPNNNLTRYDVKFIGTEGVRTLIGIRNEFLSERSESYTA
jgi:hypothetical protein